LAVLTAILLLALTTLRTSARSTSYGVADAALCVLRVARPPPQSSAGRLTQLSVLRL
jgi:hypothetical protein